MKPESSLKWLESAGGPLLLLEEHLLESWSGVFSEPSQTPFTDYDRACAVNDYIGIIAVDSGFGIVLGEEPFSTAWFQFAETKNSLLVRWVFAENESAVTDALANLQSAAWKKTGVKIQFSGDRLILFDSACNGSNINESLEIEIPKGWYAVETFHYKPNEKTSLILHRFFLS